MANQNGRAAALEESSDRWLEWLNDELGKQGPTPRSQLLGLWDVLEEWSATSDFRESSVAGASAELVEDDDEPMRSAISTHRRRVRNRLYDVARAAGVADPAGLATQLQVVLEGTIVGAMTDCDARAFKAARDLTIIALSMRMSA